MCEPNLNTTATKANGTENKDSVKMDEYINGFSDLITHGLRSPILRRPDEYGMEYEDVWFPSLDGVVLEGWFIPAKGSDKLIIANHPLPCNRYGYPGHLKGFDMFGGFECNFVKDYKALHEAGYNVLCYDLRNHGRSGAGSGGFCGIGQLECRDVVGSIKYAKSRSDTARMKISLLSRCLGGNSTVVAMSRYPEYFKDIVSMILLQPISISAFVATGAKSLGVDPEETLKKFEVRHHNATGFHLDELTPIPYCKDVKVPTLVAQVHRDSLTTPSDVQTIYDKLGSKEKDLFWIEGTTVRFDGYNYFGDHPEKMLEWFDKYMKWKVD